MVTWLPSAVPPRDLVDLDWWQPKLVKKWLGADPRWGSLSYVVVDELERGVSGLEQGIAGLVVSPWPRVDERGRLHFGDEEDSRHVTVREKDFLELLAEKRKPIVRKQLDAKEEHELRTRDLAIGDVFAARVRGRRGHRPGDDAYPDEPVDPRKWLRDEVLDITAGARDVAKLQTAAAVAGTVDAEFLDSVAQELAEDEEA
jgi:hypothetical protein